MKNCVPWTAIKFTFNLLGAIRIVAPQLGDPFPPEASNAEAPDTPTQHQQGMSQTYYGL